MTRENPRAAVQRYAGVLHVHVVNAVRKEADEFGRIDPLPQQVAGVEVESEFLAAVERLDRALSRIDIECDLGRMNFQREFDPAFLKYVENRIPALGQQGEA